MMKKYDEEEIAILKVLAKKEAKKRIEELGLDGGSDEAILFKSITHQILAEKYGIYE